MRLINTITHAIIKTGYILAISLFAISCSNKNCHYGLVDLPEFGWSKDSVKYVIFENNDTLNQHSIGILFRFNPQTTSHSQARIAIEIQSPSSEIYRDTLSCCLVINTDNKSFSTFSEQEFTFIDNARFFEQGKYIFRINHLENAPMTGIDAIGIIIN